MGLEHPQNSAENEPDIKFVFDEEHERKGRLEGHFTREIVFTIDGEPAGFILNTPLGITVNSHNDKKNEVERKYGPGVWDKVLEAARVWDTDIDIKVKGR